MGIAFNADEVFEMAEQIERNGVKFYNRAAELADNQDIRDKLLDLAKMEETHEKTFAKMRAELLSTQRTDTVPDPDNQAALYLRALADGTVFDMKADPSASITENTSLKDILETAIGLEKESIVFYLGMKEMVSENLGKSRIDAIIREEMEHITLLTGQLR